MRASLIILTVSAVCRDVHPDSLNTYSITFALWMGVHFPQEGVEEPDIQPSHAGAGETERGVNAQHRDREREGATRMEPPPRFSHTPDAPPWEKGRHHLRAPCAGLL